MVIHYTASLLVRLNWTKSKQTFICSTNELEDSYKKQAEVSSTEVLNDCELYKSNKYIHSLTQSLTDRQTRCHCYTYVADVGLDQFNVVEYNQSIGWRRVSPTYKHRLSAAVNDRRTPRCGDVAWVDIVGFVCKKPRARFTKYLPTILQLSHDNAKVTIDLHDLIYKTTHDYCTINLR